MEWRASHILVKEKGLADDLRKRLKSGAKFRDLAKEFSTCPSKSKSGDLGWFWARQNGKGLRRRSKKNRTWKCKQRSQNSVWLPHY